VQSTLKIYFEFQKESNCALKPNVLEDKMFEVKAKATKFVLEDWPRDSSRTPSLAFR